MLKANENKVYRLKKVGKQITKARIDADLTQQGLADKLEITSFRTIYNYEIGKNLSVGTLFLIADATNKPINYFFE